MAKRTIKIDLFDSKSLQSAIKQIQQYRDDLPRKCELFVRRLAEVGIPIIDQNISAAAGGFR